MSAAKQLQLAPPSALPIDPRDLIDLEPIDRGRNVYNVADLDAEQRRCVESALRMIAAGTYPGAAR